MILIGVPRGSGRRDRQLRHARRDREFKLDFWNRMILIGVTSPGRRSVPVRFVSFKSPISGRFAWRSGVFVPLYRGTPIRSMVVAVRGGQMQMRV